MKTLEEHNKEASDHYHKLALSKFPRKNGLACPKCGAELFDSHPNLTLASWPPKKDVHCEEVECRYVGYRVA